MSGMLWVRIGCVALAGAAGALLRWGAYEAIDRIFNPAWTVVWHVGTLAVNAVGCLLFGLLFEWMRHAVPLDSELRLLIFTGFLGAFTTYSTFAFDTYDLQIHRGLGAALGYVLIQVVVGWGAVLAGLAIGRAL